MARIISLNSRRFSQRQVGDLAEVDRGQDVARQQEEVAGMRVRVEEAPVEDLPQDEIAAASRHDLAVQPMLPEDRDNRSA